MRLLALAFALLVSSVRGGKPRHAAADSTWECQVGPVTLTVQADASYSITVNSQPWFEGAHCEILLANRNFMIVIA
jgi:hypothetical protein